MAIYGKDLPCLLAPLFCRAERHIANSHKLVSRSGVTVRLRRRSGQSYWRGFPADAHSSGDCFSLQVDPESLLAIWKLNRKAAIAQLEAYGRQIHYLSPHALALITNERRNRIALGITVNLSSLPS